VEGDCAEPQLNRLEKKVALYVQGARFVHLSARGGKKRGCLSLLGKRGGWRVKETVVNAVPVRTASGRCSEKTINQVPCQRRTGGLGKKNKETNDLFGASKEKKRSPRLVEEGTTDLAVGRAAGKLQRARETHRSVQIQRG